ncbi:hypothetical protein DACRYDRAFT_54164 [Dacryopinax primogenitus]|uniref:Uncharacterized protein n=1 Tax=Dacryopinax primogenitus (strain DJM 731) TaxID=1858805 RepID=M5FT26_DACPD|nr:uncharacterized protein DACRYDRAFT_54164 [Dacryopinax primogenitus]EJU00696.1 hypothetical protein DACRYDRAFT_54164 [Dacryopinax primogenitus]
MGPSYLTSVPDPESQGPIVAVPGTDWSQQLLKLAKTAELKKHTLALQIHTADIVNAQASLEEKQKALQDVRSEKNWLESERERLLEALKEVNLDRERVDLAEANLGRSIQEYQTTITTVTDGDYAPSRGTVDALRQELELPPLPSLQDTLNEKAAIILEEKRRAAQPQLASGSQQRKRGRPKKHGDAGAVPGTGELSFEGITAGTLPDGTGRNGETGESNPKRPRGRPKKSKGTASDPAVPTGGHVQMQVPMQGQMDVPQ